MIVVPGLNAFGISKGTEKSYEKILEGMEFEKLNLNNENIEMQLQEILEKTKEYFESKNSFFGGDHSISFPLVKNYFNKFGKESKLLVLDAHPDLMLPMPEPTHEEWLRAVVDFGFKPENILVVGVRRNSENVDKREIEFAKEKGIRVIFSEEYSSRIQEIKDFVSLGKFYFSIDIDVMDSSIIDSTGYPENEGLSEEEFFEILSFAKKSGNLYFFDLVEVNLEKGSQESKKKAVEVSRKILKTLNGD